LSERSGSSHARLAFVLFALSALSTSGLVACGAAGKASGDGGAGTGGSAGTAAGGGGGGGTTGGGGSTSSPGGTGGTTSTGGGGGGTTSTAGTGGTTAANGGTGGTDAGAPDAETGKAPLTQFLRIIQVTTVQGGTTVSISIDGTKNHNGAIHAAQALMMRIHVRPDTGWVAHPTVAELHLVTATTDVVLVSDPRTITGASTAQTLESTFNFDLTAAQVTTDLKFSVALRDPTGTAETPPPAIQRALYPRNGALDTLDAK
jgi:hypothetical protein